MVVMVKIDWYSNVYVYAYLSHAGYIGLTGEPPRYHYSGRLEIDNVDPETREIADRIVAAITRIAHGDERNPTGLEAVAMALAGGVEHDLATKVQDGLFDVANAVRDHAIAVEKLAHALGYRN